MSALCSSETTRAKDSRWVSKILRCHLPVKPGSASELSFLITVRDVAASARIHVARGVGQVFKSEKVAATVRGGGGEEVGGSGSGCDGGLSSDGGTAARRKGSSNDMPKFLVAGAVSTLISRSAPPVLIHYLLKCVNESCEFA